MARSPRAYVIVEARAKCADCSYSVTRGKPDTKGMNVFRNSVNSHRVVNNHEVAVEVDESYPAPGHRRWNRALEA